MKIVIQRVLKASVSVHGEVVGQIDRGLCVLAGIAPGDTEADLDWMARKLVGLRIFEDNDGKMNLSVADIGGSILIVSQFTLLADCVKGRRPSFIGAGDLEHAEKMYALFLDRVKELGVPVEHGIFRSDMIVSLDNEGPATFILETPHG